MKKLQLLLAILVLIFASQASFAQCTPDPTAMTVGFYPDTFPDGEVGTVYSAEMSAVLPLDTTVTLPVVGTLTISFCAFEVDTIFLPDGLSYACNEPGCRWSIDHAGVINRGCIAISGTPNETVMGDSIDVVIKITPGYVDTMNNYFCDTDSLRTELGLFWPTVEALLTQTAKFKMAISSNTSTEPSLEENLQVGLYPNPANDFTQFEYNLADRKEVNIRLMDATGRSLQTVFSGSSQGYQRHEINTSSLTPGIYLIHMNVEGEGTLTRKLTIQ